MDPCIYVSNGWGIHDQRWVEALRILGYSPTILRLGRDVQSPAELQSHITQSASPHTPILAGPLDSVTRHLVGLGMPIIGLSWGFDLMEMSDTAWLPELTGLIVDSEATQRIALAAGVPRERITMLPWGVDLSVFTSVGPHADLSKWDVPPGNTVLLTLRAHEPRYRTHDIIDGFARFHALHGEVCLLVGHQGSLTQELQARAATLGVADYVRFIGTIDESDLPALLRAAGAYISASEVDGTSVTLLQAMACGTPVVVSDTPGNTAWVRPGETGLTFTTGDSAHLAHQLEALVGLSPASVELLTVNAQTMVSQAANWQNNLPRLAAALDQPSLTV